MRAFILLILLILLCSQLVPPAIAEEPAANDETVAVYILGAVKESARIQVPRVTANETDTPCLTQISDALIQARGFTDIARPNEIYILRRHADPKELKAYKVDFLKGKIKKRRRGLTGDCQLESNDVIMVSGKVHHERFKRLSQFLSTALSVGSNIATTLVLSLTRN